MAQTITKLKVRDFDLTNTSWEDLRVPVTAGTKGGASDPGFTVFITDGAASTGVFAYGFDTTTEEELFFTVQIPHNYKLGTDIEAHTHWGVKASSGLTGTVRWGLEYTIANVGDAFGTTSTIYTTATAAGTQFLHHYNDFTTADISGSAIDDLSTMLLCRVFRDVANDDFANDAYLFEIDFHYEIDGFGSDIETAK